VNSRDIENLRVVEPYRKKTTGVSENVMYFSRVGGEGRKPSFYRKKTDFKLLSRGRYYRVFSWAFGGTQKGKALRQEATPRGE